ncbi:killer cell lectin-like receptor subfamily B member 1B allele B isoform X2 [Erpetoichthys calabaricus]|uniref:killer cell lectin-like receptor subfamily B member 1B allele B isoform X2 n=1 Tax=Erpetoichthys calabaricus TaxID=27687 RepID=UPI002233EF5D|nr:killer cell lectin-like receptor subfamily B member 1B allele B isoform X2 [Erpetoichthys calabaricus]
MHFFSNILFGIDFFAPCFWFPQNTGIIVEKLPEERFGHLILPVAIVLSVCLILAAGASIVVLALKTIQPCPEWWVLHREKCYYFSTNKTTWTLSEEDCISRGAQLIVVEDQEELELLRQQSRIHLTFWIGLRRKEGWAWINRQAFNSNWFSSDSTHSGDCACQTVVGIHSVNCSMNQHWICQKEVADM